MMTIGYVSQDGKSCLLPGIPRRAILSSYSCHRSQQLFVGSKPIPSFSSMRTSVTCNASYNNYKRNPDFSRQPKGSSRGKKKQSQESEQSDNTEVMDFMSSKNGSLLSPSANTRYQATATSGQREREIVELFRKVQAQLRERAAIKEEKKIEAAQQGQSKKGTVTSVLKLLRRHSGDQKKTTSPGEEFSVDQVERSNTFEDEQNINPFGPSDSKSEESDVRGPLPSARPASNFSRKSPVPRMELQPVLSAEEDINSAPSESRGRRKKTGDYESVQSAPVESVVLDGPDELSSDDQLDPSGSDETIESSSTEASPDLGSLKLSELRDLARYRGVKGYSKLKKGELAELLSA
ncbi:SAP-like protein BP-73 [Musa acuminata AAA Group]|uniref:SAP-like protein BP-73 n=1 Tax=Musa acuminata AAA Group TaxID=214697 RepID=UPI0031E133C6